MVDLKEVEMPRYLVLLEQSLQDERIIERLRAMRAEGVSFHLLVPVRPVSEEEKEFIQLEVDERPDEGDDAAVMARWRLRDAISVLEESGLAGHVDGEVGRSDPIDAVEDALARQHFDQVVIVTSRPGIAGWLHLDTASRIERKLDIPVIHLERNVKQNA